MMGGVGGWVERVEDGRGGGGLSRLASAERLARVAGRRGPAAAVQ